MHPKMIARRTSDAHNRTVAAMQSIAAAAGVSAPNLSAARDRDPVVQRLKESELVADFLESIAGLDAPEPPSLLDAVAAATVEELTEIPGVGEATAKRIKAQMEKQDE